MMSGGELKKRIEKEYKLKDCDAQVFAPETYLCFRGVWKILAEAKKDFPKPRYIGFSCPDGEGSYEEDGYDQFDTEEMMVWFKRWFGE